MPKAYTLHNINHDVNHDVLMFVFVVVVDAGQRSGYIIDQSRTGGACVCFPHWSTGVNVSLLATKH